MANTLKNMMLFLITGWVIAGVAMEVKTDKEIEVERDFNISTPTGNYKFDSDKEFIEFMEGWNE